MMKKRRIGNMTEYTETILHKCGHKIDYVTLGYKIARKHAVELRQNPCARCVLELLIAE